MNVADLYAEIAPGAPVTGLVATGEGTVELRRGDEVNARRVEGYTHVTEAVAGDGWSLECTGDVQLGVQVRGIGIVWATPP